MITGRLAGGLEQDEMDRLVAELEGLEEEEDGSPPPATAARSRDPEVAR